MKAVTYHRYGDPSVLTVGEIKKPKAKKGQLLIKVCAVEATKTDCELRSFKFGVGWFWLPMRLAWGIFKPRKTILGSYFSGEVVEVHSDTCPFQVGDQVFGTTGFGFGAYGEYVAVPDTAVLELKPDNMSHTDAAAVPLGGFNGLHFIRLADIQPGDRVLVNGAGGVIGAHGVQIAKAMGADVTAVDIGYKEEFIRGLGADHFIDYTQADFTKAGEKYDVVFDMVPSSSYGRCLRCLNKGGMYLMGNPTFGKMLRAPLTNRFSNKSVNFKFAKESPEELGALKDLIEAGDVKSIVGHVLPMEDIAEAHRLVETEERVGAVVIDMTK